MKPSKIKVIKAKRTHLLLPGFKAIMLFGILYCRKKTDIDSINETDEINSQLKSHETIHIRQAEDCKNSWFIYYMRYIWQWICNLPLIVIDSHAPYKFIPFEIEAYTYQNNWEYCKGKCDAWRRFRKLSIKEKRIYAKEYYRTHKWPITV